ncbi:hypothetical protein LSH36_1g20012 [Paralvinella palmiformis]|uniref:TGF-beta propeptide domain-containing protein n=1 Tax=Paralvinella palmiformis TaxID=53620 RepID=A0AAD9NKP8_9ANNE|nr:hypothetical protein LSH36_1g20012 [Paralvinella palmiformis]
MKIARSIVIAALMSSFLVLGFESEDAAAPPPEDRHLAHATATGSDIWVEATPSGLRDVRPEGGRSSVDDDGDAPTAFNGNDVTEAESSSRERFADQSASDDENVIITSDVDGAVPESGSRTRRPAGARSSVAKSVIRSKSPNKMAPTAESRDQRRPDAQPSRISQLSRREREQLLNNLESSFLKIVGLQSRPRPSGQVTVPQYMRELYQRHRGQPPVHQGTALHNSNTIRSFFDTGVSGTETIDKTLIGALRTFQLRSGSLLSSCGIVAALR